MIIRELLGTVSEQGRVHLAHDAPDHRADERTTGCTDNGASPLAITAVIGVVDEDSHEALLAIFHAVDINPDSLCRRCFGSWVREPYSRQWTARTSPPAADLDAVVVDARLSAYITSITVAEDPDRGGVVDGFVVRVGGGTSRRFVEVANAAARATVRRMGWRGATLSTVTVRGDDALAAYGYRPSDDMNGLYHAGHRSEHVSGQVSVTAAGSGRAAPRLVWETGTPSTMRGVIPTSSEGTVTITLDGTALIRIDLVAGRVMIWPDGEDADIVAKVPPERTSRFNPAFAWTTPTGVYQGLTFSSTGHEHIEVWRHTDTDNRDGAVAWQRFGRFSHDPMSPTSMMVEFDEWRMRTTGYVLPDPYPAWTAVHRDVRDASGLPPQPAPDTDR